MGGVLDTPWAGSSFNPPTALDIATIETAIVTRLTSGYARIERDAMVDSGGAKFSLMYLPLNTTGLPAAVGAIIPITATSRVALGLSVAWDAPLTAQASRSVAGASETLVLYAVYGFGQKPAL
jgi:hypothetical protein